VNQLFWRDRETYDELVSSLAEVAAAQREALTGGTGAAVREAMRRKSEALASAARQAERRLVEGGGSSSPAILQRLTATLSALASPRAPDATAPRAGRLTAELQASGFDVALGLDRLDLPPAPRRPAEAESPFEGEGPPPAATDAAEDAALAEREARRQLAEREVARAQRTVEAAVQALGEAEARTAAAQADVDTLRKRMADAESRAARQAAAEQEARDRLDAARADLSAAERALDGIRATNGIA
jgi:hypothetical protein